MSRASVVKEIVEFAAEGVGNSYLSALELGFTDRKTDLLTRVSFKVENHVFFCATMQSIIFQNT